MAEFIYSTSTNVRGPWLVTQERLEALDKVIEQEWERLLEYRHKSLKKIAEERSDKFFKSLPPSATVTTDVAILEKNYLADLLSYAENKAEKSLSIRFKSGRKLSAHSFQEALRLPDVLEEVPIGFEVRLRSMSIDCRISLEEQTNSLQVRVVPEGLPESRELYAALQQWIIGTTPPKWQQLWVEHAGALWMIWFLALILGVGILDTGVKAKLTFKDQARQLLVDGLAKDEELKALETLLALASEYNPASQNLPLPVWFKILFVVGLVICLVLSFKPKTVLGVGKGRALVNRWNIWIRVLFFTVPSLLFAGILFPFIIERIKHLLF